MERVRWGILGTGSIAKQIAGALPEVGGADLVAVGSRTRAGADQFGAAFGVPRRHASYEALAHDPDVDLIYVATPNAFHFAHASLALEAGKGVLVEKPFTVNAREAEALVQLARERRRFLMEAMWTRFIPAVRQAFAWIAAGAIGEVRLVEASFGFRAEGTDLDSLLSRELAVGSLLDVGVYSVSLARAVFGRNPVRAISLADLTAEGVDRQMTFTLGWDGGGLAHGAAAVTHETPHDASIAGTRGRIQLHAPFWRAPRATLLRPGHEDVIFDNPSAGSSYVWELAAVTEHVREGRLEHSAMPLEESIEIMRILDQLRASAGIRFAADDVG